MSGQRTGLKPRLLNLEMSTLQCSTFNVNNDNSMSLDNEDVKSVASVNLQTLDLMLPSSGT